MSDPVENAVKAVSTVINPFGAIEAWLIRIAAYIVLISIFAGVVIAVWERLRHPAEPKVEAAAPAVVQADKSVIAERQATTPTYKPTVIIPKGDTEIRHESVTVQQAPEKIAPNTTTFTPPPVTINLDVVKQPDGTERAIASTGDGTIVKTLDIPVAPPPPDPPKSALGLSAGTPFDHGYAVGLWAEHDVGRLRLALEVDHIGSARGSFNTGMVRVGWTF